MPSTLSIALIVRDEAQLLPECLRSIQPVADEICLVDTGSSDDTLVIAQAFGCRTLEYPWTNDFAAARNVSLDLCTGDWIFVLDADERLAPESLPQVRALLEGPRNRGYRFTTRNYTHNAAVGDFVPVAGDPHARGFAGWFPSVKVRLFPRDPRIRFEHRVHEVVTHALVRCGFGVMDATIPVLHYPLLKAEALVQRKQEMYLELGRQKVREEPENAQAQAELGTQLVECGQLPEALRAFREAVRLDPANAMHLKDLGAVLALLGHPRQAEQALLLAVQHDPQLVDAWRNLGVIAAQQGDWPRALEYFETGLATQPANPLLQEYVRHARSQALK